MTDQVVLYPTASSNLRRTRSTTGAAWQDDWKQAQNEPHFVQGQSADDKTQYASLIQFALTGLHPGDDVVGAHLHLFTATDHSGFVPLNKGTNLRIGPKKATWSQAGGGEKVWTGSVPNGAVADLDPNADVYARMSAVNLAENVIDIGLMVQWWLPANIKYKGAPGKGKKNYGAVMVMAGSDMTNVGRTCLATDHHVNTGIRPFLVLDVNLAGGDGTVTTSAPNGDIPRGTPQFFTGIYAPGRPGDTIASVQIKRIGGGPDLWLPTPYIPNAGEIAASTFAVPVPESWPSATPYTWVAQVKNSKSGLTPLSAALPVRWMGTPPDLTAPQPSGVTIDSLISVHFRATVNVHAGTFRAERWRIQLRGQTLPTDPSWADGILWDTGPLVVPLSADEKTAAATEVVQSLSTLYGGPTLPGSTNYSWRVQAIDVFGATSPWTYSDFVLTTPYVPAVGEVVDLTGYAKPAPHRIRLFAVDKGTGKGRGPGALVAELTDAAHVGASEFYNSAGEFFFTLPATHPQASVIEPYNVHYALEHHTGNGWVGKAFGLITDFDATEDEVIFYGTDYLGLLARSVEERFDPNDAEKSEPAGAKYNKKRIDYIVGDQLAKAKEAVNSPVGFIAVGPIAAMPEAVTVYASFKQRLPFISGLIDSARAGTGRRTRLVCVKLPNGTFQWQVILEPGVNRANLRMEYGGLVQGFRVVPFGGWGTAVDAIGRTILGTKVYSATATAAGIDEAVYGRWPSLATFSDIDDINDLRRRAAQSANRGGKVGKQMGIGVRVGSLGVKDGWDITDSLPLAIKRGVVDTTIDPATGHSRYGSGYWTVWGWTWNSYPDGHSSMVLSFGPREDDTGPTPGDLIPSAPILASWQVGYGVATGWGNPPSPTPPPTVFALTAGFTDSPDDFDPGINAMTTTYPLSTESVLAENYMDLNTGCVYTLDSSGDNYVLSYCPPSGGGGGTPYVPDTTPPDVITIKTLVALEATQQDDGTTISALQGTVGYASPPSGLTDLAEVAIQSTRYAAGGVPDWTRATVWTVPSADATGTLDTVVTQPNVVAGETYYWRATTVDVSGNRQQTWSSPPVSVVAASDEVGPPQVTGIVVKPGMNSLGARWNAVLAPDFAYTEVQVRESPAGEWVSVTTGGTVVVLTSLLNDTLYDLRLRSVDSTGNTKNADGTDGTADDPDAGWSAIVQGTPTAIPGSALVWDEADIEAVFAGMIDADWIQTGTLKVGTGAGNADAIEVFDSAGKPIGKWTSDGIILSDPAHPDYTMVLDEAGLVVYTNMSAVPPAPIPVVTIGPLGIDAASITFGSARGGHNLVQNSSFELGAFGSTADVANTWDVAADWNATRVGADVNITVGASTLAMTVV